MKAQEAVEKLGQAFDPMEVRAARQNQIFVGSSAPELPMAMSATTTALRRRPMVQRPSLEELQRRAQIAEQQLIQEAQARELADQAGYKKY